MSTLARSVVTSVAALALLFTATACGTTDTSGSAAAQSPSAASADCADDTTATSTDPVSMTDDLGRTLELDKPAERVVVLEWQEVEDALTLCVTPVGVASPDGYTTYVTAEQLPEGVASVGERGEPDLDSIYALDPDLIIVDAFSDQDPVLTQLDKGDVPVLAVKGNDSSNPIGNMKNVFSQVAEATGRTERATAVLNEFDAHLAEKKQEVAEVKMETTDFLFFDGWVDGSNLTIRPYTDGALFTELGKELGLTPAWSDDVNKSFGSGGVNKEYGLAQTDVEGLAGVGEANLFYSNDAGTGWTSELTSSEIWKNLSAVKEGRTFQFPNIWGAGGPKSTSQAVDAFTDALTSASEAK
ncbi:iron-siderophore ABC transporter substrate-binding protein [Glutamicibacter sp. BW77]|uniref:ABC transporter substrate-binding protein n=1 Tax=Glutamicibacter bergerei TaxID=256702 RepID=A0ABV9MIY9_9MICC|nr:iron-siderophore ABC transporter substrate-binding protein [Glutamicibacter sp. BW77]PCC35259.1 Fe3+-hydroxamate ABC transporter [Glutamicibacter sp. BW77]HBV09365.1 iron-siderophore ABC transporter substrate-binding protein [Micrococcaceae bacterium]